MLVKTFFPFPLWALHIIAIAVYKVEKIIYVCIFGMGRYTELFLIMLKAVTHHKIYMYIHTYICVCMYIVEEHEKKWNIYI